MSLSKTLRLDGTARKQRLLRDLAREVNALADETAALDDEALAARTEEFRARLEQGESPDDLLPEAFAVCREAALRTLGMRPYDVQVMAGAALHYGWAAEMKTGEGKTLAAALPSYLNALTGRGVHVVTVNSYLASRDAAEIGHIHRFLGLTVGVVHESTDEHKEAYDCDITYATSTELGFDYLRDNMATETRFQVQRGHHFAIVDELDSILIDEARTPMLISGPAEFEAGAFQRFEDLAQALERDVHYEVDEKDRLVILTDAGVEAAQDALEVPNLYDLHHTHTVSMLTAALRAKEIYVRDRDYVVRDDEVLIVDTYTGRILPGRRWNEGLHQALECKEGVSIQGEAQTFATITYQNFFSLYEKVGGMSGTLMSEAEELGRRYGLETVEIPTHRPTVRMDQGDLVFKTQVAKLEAVVADVTARHRSGQPVLVGTASVEHSEHLSGLLEAAGVPHVVLNAKQHAREALVIAQAGRPAAVTVATNMAGRGTDVLLGGHARLLALGELAAELDVEVPVDPFAADALIEDHAQRFAQLLASASETCARDGERVRALGGLYVLGTERHTARRIDDQLRGRAGRQGDVGESRFYLSLEDDLMRIYAQAAVGRLLGRSLPDVEALELKSVARAVRRAQEAIEAYDAGNREAVGKYDSVFDIQRRTVYAARQALLEGDEDALRQRLYAMVRPVVDAVVADHCLGFAEQWDLDTTFGRLHYFMPGIARPWATRDPYSCPSAEQFADELTASGIAVLDETLEAVPWFMREQLLRLVMLTSLDRQWRAHLLDLDFLRSGIGLRSVAQTDPISAWKSAGYDLFEVMWDDLRAETVGNVCRIRVEDASSETANPADDELSGAGLVAAASAQDGPDTPLS